MKLKRLKKLEDKNKHLNNKKSHVKKHFYYADSANIR